VRTLNMPEVRTRLAESTIEASSTTPEALAAFVKAEIEKWAKVVAEARIAKQ
jgi:tripartite-type tricarboxylate transporter receptor subunit TctC